MGIALAEVAYRRADAQANRTSISPCASISGGSCDMTVRTRIIPCLDVANGRVVKGVNFVDLADAGDPVEQARLYDAAGAARSDEHTSELQSLMRRSYT